MLNNVPIPIKSVPLKNGPILAQKMVDSNGILVIFKEEIEHRPIYSLNMTKIPLESTLF